MDKAAQTARSNSLGLCKVSFVLVGSNGTSLLEVHSGCFSFLFLFFTLQIKLWIYSFSAVPPSIIVFVSRGGEREKKATLI